MLAPELKSKINKLWDLFWSGGIANPLTAIEQISYLIFMKRLDDSDLRRKEDAEWLGQEHISIFEGKEDLRWSSWKHMGDAREMLEHVRDNVFPFIQKLNGEGGTFAKMMKDAVFIIPKPSLLVEAVEVVDGLKISEQNIDTQGDIFEYLLSELKSSGKNGQFRTPRHIIKMMAELIDPQLGETICDPASGTGGFLIGAYQHILNKYTSPENITVEEDGTIHGLVGDKITDEKVWDFLRKSTFYGYDFDSTMLRIATMNLVLHGIELPNLRYADTLSKGFEETEKYNVILANPPFKGSIDKSDINEGITRLVGTTKTELLFLAEMYRLLVVGGRCAVIVPDGVLFGSSKAHKAVRELLVEKCQLEGVISMPSGVFKPYAGVSTAVLIFTKGGETDKVWFYNMEADGFSLDDKRVSIKQNDIPGIIESWKNCKKDKASEPQKSDKWFWVEKNYIKQNAYDLSINKYMEIEYEEKDYEKPEDIMDRIESLEQDILADINELKELMKV